jgi:hypothetical protein
MAYLWMGQEGFQGPADDGFAANKLVLLRLLTPGTQTTSRRNNYRCHCHSTGIASSEQIGKRWAADFR